MSKIKLSKKHIYRICKDALKEDLHPSGDITSKLLKHNYSTRIKNNQLVPMLELMNSTPYDIAQFEKFKIWTAKHDSYREQQFNKTFSEFAKLIKL